MVPPRRKPNPCRRSTCSEAAGRANDTDMEARSLEVPCQLLPVITWKAHTVLQSWSSGDSLGCSCVWVAPCCR